MSHVMKGSRLQDIAAEVIQKHAFGIERGVRKSARIARGDQPSQIYNRSVRQLHQDLPLELEAKRDELKKFSDRVDEMQARVKKLEAKEELKEKEAKRLATYRNRLAARVEEYTEAKALLEAKQQTTQQQEDALKIKERVLDIAEEKLDERETSIDQRDVELAVREDDVARREGALVRLTEELGKLVNGVADRLGVGKSLRAIIDRLKSASNELSDDGPSLG